MTGRSLFALAFVLSLGIPGCPEPPPPLPPPTPRPVTPAVARLRDDSSRLATRPEQTVDEVEVQHILIGYKDGGTPGVTRTLDEAERRAADLYLRAQAGEDFTTLVQENTDDQPPGIYTLIKKGSPAHDSFIFKRDEMVLAFGEVGFRLIPGEIGVATFHPVKSPYGYHIIKRLK